MQIRWRLLPNFFHSVAGIFERNSKMVPALSEQLLHRPHFHPTQRYTGVCGITSPYLVVYWWRLIDLAILRGAVYKWVLWSNMDQLFWWFFLQRWQSRAWSKYHEIILTFLTPFIGSQIRKWTHVFNPYSPWEGTFKKRIFLDRKTHFQPTTNVDTYLSLGEQIY